jgi:hypothetical protein
MDTRWGDGLIRSRGVEVMNAFSRNIPLKTAATRIELSPPSQGPGEKSWVIKTFVYLEQNRTRDRQLAEEYENHRGRHHPLGRNAIPVASSSSPG